MHGFDRLGAIKSHETVLIQGSGPIGIFCAAVAKDHGSHVELHAELFVFDGDGRSAAARAALADDAAFDAAWADGRAMTMEQAIALALGESDA